jgi:DNA-binding response OmpR family regulator
MSKLLLVEDDLPLGSSLQRVLTVAGHHVVWVRNAADAQRFLAQPDWAASLLDIGLPDRSGLSLLAWLRGLGQDLPVIILTARDSVDERVQGLDSGADDYLPKPFAMEELLSRLRALLRRSARQPSNVWQLGELALDTARRRALWAGAEVPLSTREYDILKVMATQPDKVLTRQQIERAIGTAALNDSNAIDVHMYKLRRKLPELALTTVRGVGYVLETGASPLPQAQPA